MKTPAEYEKLLVQLSETNYVLSVHLSRQKVDGHISHIFGKPLDEVYYIILEHEKKNG